MYSIFGASLQSTVSDHAECCLWLWLWLTLWTVNKVCASCIWKNDSAITSLFAVSITMQAIESWGSSFTTSPTCSRRVLATAATCGQTAAASGQRSIYMRPTDKDTGERKDRSLAAGRPASPETRSPTRSQQRDWLQADTPLSVGVWAFC